MIMSGHYNFKDRTGEVIYIQSLGNARIIEYRGTNDCDIEVVSTGDILRNLRYSNIKIGAVKNLYLPVVFGVGYFGEGITNLEMSLMKRLYTTISGRGF